MPNRWYMNKDLLVAAREEYKTFEAMSKNVGGADASTLANWWRRLGLEKLPKGPAPSSPANQEALRRLYERVS